VADAIVSLTPYAELAEVIASLPLLLREARRARGLSLRAAARELGLSFSTVDRIERGEDCALSNATTVLRWLGQPPRATGSSPSGEVS
jgi:ribosome-binding protein aMBF1 (putative translation factor)